MSSKHHLLTYVLTPTYLLTYLRRSKVCTYLLTYVGRTYVGRTYTYVLSAHLAQARPPVDVGRLRDDTPFTWPGLGVGLGLGLGLG